MKCSIVWFRNDLRLHDNEALQEAIGENDSIIPVYIFDERTFRSTTKYGFPKTNKFRTKFIIESVADLKSNLQLLGTDLIVKIGKPEELIYELALKYKTRYVYCNRERTLEELTVQDNLENKLWQIGQEVRYSRGKMLYYTSDLPFPISHCPDIFSNFKKEVEKLIPIRKPLPSPDEKINSPDNLESQEIPSLQDFGFEEFTHDSFQLKGGESNALKELRYYFWETDAVANYYETRNQLLGRDFSSKFSPYLAQGCISPKRIYAELQEYESSKVQNKSTYWLFFELLWRDFFRFMAKKHGNNIFKPSGTRQKRIKFQSENFELFDKWKNGNTGIPFIDANMRELNSTGFMSNRGRQNVASFLINDLKLNWLLGAEYFESMLIDYDPCSNYGNWNYLAGVGSDPREDRYFNIASQAKKYDPDGTYIKYWLPELTSMDDIDLLHNPFAPSKKKWQEKYGYPLPCIEIKHWN